ncbi:hypothetical protein [Halioxenophilus aromaticivorans]|uniref:Glycosyl transferase n=1 Tax=Halioxenophilus aromaticivorans TaxID=1306992 RepID=A0AAV3U094_9ALTE
MSQNQVPKDDINLEDFEQAIYSRNYERATMLLIQALSGFEQGTWDLVTVDQHGVSRNRKYSSAKKLLTRLCSAATAFLCDPNLVLNRHGFELLLFYKRYLVTVFAATDFVDMRHCLEFIGDRKNDASVSYKSDADLYKVIVASSATTGAELITTLLQALPTDLAFLFWLSLLDNEMVLTIQADETRNQVLEYSERFTKVVASDAAIHRVVNTWMFCSYMNNLKKHKIKIPLNAIVKNYCQAHGAKQPFISNKRVLKQKPTLLVICERFTSTHAMFRCYGRAIESLKASYRIVLLTAHNRADSNSVALFDDAVLLPQGQGIKAVKATIGKIINIAPDMIYYPSLGMDAWVVALAQYRLAPIQLMTMGHPATSYCDNIDYLFAEESTLGDAGCVNETCLHVKDGTFAMSKGTLTYQAEITIRENPDSLKIALPSIAYKLNPSVLKACQEIKARSKRPVEFHFFPNMRGVNHLAIHFRLQEILPCVVHENQPYSQYMSALNECDIVLSPFPFGNTNGFIDSGRLALPVVCLDGPEAHSHTDVALSERFGLPDFCRTQNVEQYIAAAVRLVDDDTLRVSVSQALKNKNIDGILYAQTSANPCADMERMFNWVYQYHEQIKAQSKHLWTVADRYEFVPQSQPKMTAAGA